MSLKEKWCGIKLLKQDYKPMLYAKKDRFGNYTTLEGRAQATAEHRAEEQWKSKGAKDILNVKNMLRENSKRKQQMDKIQNIRDVLISLEEFELVIKRMTRSKAPGPDNITTDWLKNLDEENRIIILAMINHWWENEYIPTEMEEARVASLYKKGDPRQQDNYRPISLLNTFYKVIAAVIKMRLEEGLEREI